MPDKVVGTKNQGDSYPRSLLCGASFLHLGTKTIINKEMKELTIKFNLVSRSMKKIKQNYMENYVGKFRMGDQIHRKI